MATCECKKIGLRRSPEKQIGLAYMPSIINLTNTVDLVATENDKEYLPVDYGADAFRSVKTEIAKVKVRAFSVSNDCINEEGIWEGYKLVDFSLVSSFSFTDCSKLKELSLSALSGRELQFQTYALFKNCSSLEELELSGTRIYSTYFNHTFEGCKLLKKIDISGWSLVGGNGSCWAAFSSCESVTELDTYNLMLDVDNLTNVGQFFRNCKALEWCDLRSWHLPSSQNTSYMFYHCYSLKSIVRNLTIEQVLNYNISALSGLRQSISLMDTQLDRASLRALINGLADLTGQTAQTLTLGATLIAKLTEEDIAIATNKNWTIA